MREDLVRLLGSKIESARMTSQAVKPAAWVLSLVALVSAPLLLYGALWIQVIAAVWFTATLLFTVFLIDHFRRKDPDRLGSETYLTRRHAIDVAAKDPGLAQAILQTVASDQEDPAPSRKAILDHGKRHSLPSKYDPDSENQVEREDE